MNTYEKQGEGGYPCKNTALVTRSPRSVNEIIRRLNGPDCEGPPSGNISKDSLVYQRKYLPGTHLQASLPRRPGQGRRNYAMNVPASRLTEKMALTLATSLLAAAVLLAPVAAAQA